MELKIKKVHPDAIIPKYQTTKASGFDLHALQDVILQAGETKLIRTGLAFGIPEGHEMQVRPRSGLSLKTKLRICNAPGTIDEDYFLEVCVIVENTNNTYYSKNGETEIIIKKGERIAQGVICPIERVTIVEVDDLGSNDSNRIGGFGSTST